MSPTPSLGEGRGTNQLTQYSTEGRNVTYPGLGFFSWNANAKSLLTDLSWLHIGSENNSSYYLQVNDFSSRSIENYPNPAILPNIVY